MGRELAVLLASEGCHLALCDVLMENLHRTRELAAQSARPGTRITVSECDVANESAVDAFRDEVARQHETDHVDLLFNNAGIGGGSSFLIEPREHWDRTFAVCWGGVYNCTRAFMPLLVASKDAHLINTSSVNGFWACSSPAYPHTAYAAAKFAVKGFTEALIVDTRVNAPHVKVSLVMPGHIATPIIQNSARILHKPDAPEMTKEDLEPHRASLRHLGVAADFISDEQLRDGIHRFHEGFRDKAPTTAAQAARIILEGVRAESWRILVGPDAQALDEAVRENPDQAYEKSFLEALLTKKPSA
jgi:NAD(P)-dependent dehydrogenase (short-subunit alcohol dehydrogenase family)